MNVTVYHFRAWNPGTDEYIVPDRKSPAERIERIGGTILPGTAEEVEDSVLDEHGRYEPRRKNA
jgi:hypothetical protein